jgi:hypothetical protein
MNNPFKPHVSVPLRHSMNTALNQAHEEAGRAAQRLAQWRNEQEMARVIDEARARIAARKRSTR